MGISSLNNGQLSAVESNHNKILCLAGAGTGKTHTLIHRMGRLISSHICNGRNILSLTFTNAAAFEMKDRFLREYPELASECPEFRTFHAFCYSLISKDISVRSHIGYSQVPSICTEEDKKKLEQKVKLACNIKLSDCKLKKGEKPSLSEKYEYDLFHKALKREMKKQNVITFDMLCYDVCKMFESNHIAIQRYKDQYSYIFVDEFQDTDPKQWYFVKSFSNSNLFVVGDALQSLYSFRGADSSIIKSLASDREWHTIKLTDNYRSSPEICEYANDITKYADPSYRILMNPTKESEGRPVYQSQCQRGNRYSEVSEECLSLLASDIPTLEGSVAILCRTNREVETVYQELYDCGIPVKVSNIAEEGKKIFTACRDNNYAVTWLSSYLPKEEYADWIRICEINQDDSDDERYAKFRQFTKNRVIQQYIQKIRNIRSIMADNRMESSFKCFYIFEQLNLRNRATCNDGLTKEEICEYIESQLGYVDECAVYVGTIHSSKGLEYDNVIVINVGGFTFPLSNEDQNNCFYVAVTRAKKFLKIYWPT